MHKFLIRLPVVAVVSLMALPALAQTNGSKSNSATNTPPSADQMEQNLKQDLSKAGYTDIKVFPGSFLVRAKDSKGDPMEMLVSPNSVTEITDLPGGKNSAHSSSNSTQSNSETSAASK